MTPELQETPIPPDMAARLPALASLRTELLSNIIILQAGQVLVRAAWNEASIWPLKVERTYRFGPPAELARPSGFPYHWIYIADDADTAAWEAQLCCNDVMRPGTFYMAHRAEQALIATLSFSMPLRLLDLTGLAASRLGIYDQLRSPDHGWCQWLGWGSWIRSLHRRHARFTASSTRRAGSPASWPTPYPRATWRAWARPWRAHSGHSETVLPIHGCWPTACAWTHPDLTLPTPARATGP
ncbi:hypothetical protein [Janthinobacterium lividum]|uniref:RES domain-containing protein n=1 Tax=Janthinobacterium lividum TaxID=29581 RepID=A0ABU0XN24_9BURK|nr:hypothetical protein [Janthinobacterium lividum]MDQ4624923.1 hypothetical protein [Janthinobacterium lividum]MDQ4673474.1 hypothetical protein [Janthinobacterium lividum]MDQ4684204.1 hypothetical protein [Janthinobacterium lividum]